LDGYGCQYLTTKHFKNIKCYNANYGAEIGARIEQIISDIVFEKEREEKGEESTIRLILITDLNLSTKECRVLEREAIKVGAKPLLLDHHLTGGRASEIFSWYNLDATKSATKLTYGWLQSNYRFDPSKKYEEIVESINAIDVWVENSPYFAYGKVLLGMISGAKDINRVLFPDEDRLYKFALIDFSKRVLKLNPLEDAPIVLDDSLHGSKKEFFMDEKNDTKDNLVADYVTKLLTRNRDKMTVTYRGYKGILGYNIGNTSLIGNRFLVTNPDYDFYMDVNSRGTFSLRSNNRVDVSEMAKEIGGGGGHPNASGGKIENYKDSFVYFKLKESIQKYMDSKSGSS
jgi:oligoribonuclease NrnB/cAMP/cGMP phosphodiesterase (DHH superfamily)